VSAPVPDTPPKFLVCDSDVLVQLFKSCDIHLLKWIRRRYGLQAIVTEAVDVELRWMSKYGNQFEKPLAKALEANVIQLADSRWTEGVVQPSAAARVAFEGYLTLGGSLAKRVGTGEAFTHAMATTFDWVAVSNDQRAIEVLHAHGTALSEPVLRFFDLVCLAHQAGEFTEAACNQVCKDLHNRADFVQREFEHASFADGLKTFVPRVYDSTLPLVGSSGTLTGAVGTSARLAIAPVPD
jgi:hypothetical protein